MPSPPPSPPLREFNVPITGPPFAQGLSSGPSNSTNEGDGNGNSNGNGHENGGKNGVGHLSFLNQYLHQKKVLAEWKYDSIHEDTKAVIVKWTARLNIDGEEVAFGKGVSKKVAMNEAAKEALAVLGVFVSCKFFSSHGTRRPLIHF